MTDCDVGQAVLGALEARRSMATVQPQQPPRELVERVIQAAVWAPNHYRTVPWRFTVLAGEAREELGRVMADSLRAKLDDPSSPDCIAMLDRERRKPLRAPVVIAVAIPPSDNPKVVPIEDIAAGAAGVQNMLLAAEALGLGAMWRTGAPAYDPRVKRFLGYSDESHLLAFVYLGYPDPLPLPQRTTDATRLTNWRGWNELDLPESVDSSAPRSGTTE